MITALANLNVRTCRVSCCGARNGENKESAVMKFRTGRPASEEAAR